ncbi:hypothetical protein QEH56_24030 [Pelagicoccus enzymogenes]|uniref:hypothetical protein n=1 Tax=Pelagicoccus enzymogenes TaxID=2773457 RepID=UPI00280CC454|nr:hypothetical protein [Pelagicoccus enzymogenes]MDQ8201255.1 hypothetical protein [Pelagicoccus enzymogenes]
MRRLLQIWQRLPAFLRRPHLPFIGTLACGSFSIALALGAIHFPWLSVPTPAASLPSYHDASIVSEDAPVTNVFKISYALLFLSTLWIIGLGPKKWQKRATGLICFALTILLFAFPYSVWQIDSHFSARAQWLQNQHYHLTWLGGDIFTRQMETFEDDNLVVYVVDPPREANVVKIPLSLPSLFQLGQIAEIQTWLGYTSSFHQFISKGWILANLSFCLLLLFLFRSKGTLDLPLVRYALKVSISSFTLLCVLGILPIAHTAYQMGKAHEALLDADYGQAYGRMERATWSMPIIREDSRFFMQKGLIAYRLGLTLPEADYYRASVLEADGFYQQAEALYQEILQFNGSRSDVRRECLRAIARAAVYDMNTQQFELAENKFRKVLAWDPTDLKSNYSLQMVLQRKRDAESIAALTATMRRIYQDFAAKNKAPVLQNAERNLEFATYDLPGEVVYEQ